MILSNLYDDFVTDSVVPTPVRSGSIPKTIDQHLQLSTDTWPKLMSPIPPVLRFIIADGDNYNCRPTVTKPKTELDL